MLNIPHGLKPAKVLSERLLAEHNYLEYLEFTERKFNQIVLEVYRAILDAVGKGKKVNLIIPLNGGLLFYRLLMRVFSNNLLFTNAINIIFCDENEADELEFSEDPLDLSESFNLVIDDIWDKGGTGSEIIQALRRYADITELAYYAFCKKESSPESNNGAYIANQRSIVVYPDEWLHGWGGMNSSKFEGVDGAEVTALERTSFLPLIPSGELEFNSTDIDAVQEYIDFLTQTNLAINGVVPIETYYDILFLEYNPRLKTRFEYLRNINQEFIRTEQTIPESIDVES